MPGIARASVDQIIQIGAETTPGVRASGSAMRRLPGVSIDLKPNSETQAFRAMGYNINTTSIINKQWANGSWTGPVDFNQIIYPLSGLFGLIGAAPVQIGATAGYTWDFNPVPAGADPFPKTFSCEYGDGDAAMLALQMQFQSFSMDWTDSGLTMSGNVFSRYPTDDETLTPSSTSNEIQSVTVDGTGGTYTLTYSGATTAAIPFNATASALQELLIDLNTIPAGGVHVTGGPGSAGGATPYFVEFMGALAGTNVAAMTASAASLTGGAGTVVITTTQAGGTAGSVVTIPQRPASRMQVDIFADDTFGGIGSTKIVAAYQAGISVADKVIPFWALNTDYPSYADVVRQAADVQGSFSTAHNAASRAIYATIVNNPDKFIRMLITGANIGVSADELIQVDFCGRFAQPEIQKDTNGVLGYKYNFNVINNESMGGGYQMKVVNRLTDV